ncbi:hypothetical protein HK102_010156, partial [Quaeritorhiza haematococci]
MASGNPFMMGDDEVHNPFADPSISHALNSNTSAYESLDGRPSEEVMFNTAYDTPSLPTTGNNFNNTIIKETTIPLDDRG